MIHVLVAGERPIIRSGIRAVVESWPDLTVIGEITGEDIPEKVLEGEVDILLLDVPSPEFSFFDSMSCLRSERPGVRTLVFSARPENETAVRALRAGAAGHITDDRTPEDLANAIRRIHATGRYVSRELGERLADELFLDRRCSPHEALSGQELRVLCLLTAGRSAKQIAAAMKLSPKTVSTYRARLLDKLDASTNAELIRYGLEHSLGK